MVALLGCREQIDAHGERDRSASQQDRRKESKYYGEHQAQLCARWQAGENIRQQVAGSCRTRVHDRDPLATIAPRGGHAAAYRLRPGEIEVRHTIEDREDDVDARVRHDRKLLVRVRYSLRAPAMSEMTCFAHFMPMRF
jgi:hypothetical protein